MSTIFSRGKESNYFAFFKAKKSLWKDFAFN